jgi:autotransporter passenger strand-loop-strand repeat protein
MLVTTGADCLSATVFGSGELEVHGEASGTVLHGGVELVANGGLNRNATVSSGGSEDLADNGSALGTLVLSGGDLLVDAGGTAISVTLSGGFMRVGGIDAFFDHAEALAIRTSVAAGTLLISTGGTAISGFIGGTAIVEAGGVALDLEFGGILNLSSGGTAIRTIIQSLETVENVFAGATDLSADVIFGSQNIFSGGEAEDASVFGSFAVQTVSAAGPRCAVSSSPTPDKTCGRAAHRS